MSSREKTRRIHLTLKEKIELINVSECDKCSVRALAAQFKIGKSQVSDILKKKKDFLDQWSQHKNENAQKSFPKSIGRSIDNVTYEWFCRARAVKIPLSGPLIREKAMEVARGLGANDFKASVGWLDKFKTRHNISWKVVSGEAGSVDTEVVTQWTEKLKDLCAGFSAKDIFNCDETGLFFKALPDKTMSLKSEKCRGGKISKERLTILICSNMLGEFEQPLIIGKVQNPRCFKGMTNAMNVDWKSNKKAWMTRDIMGQWLDQFNRKMIRQERKIILFMDNAASHPHIELTNIHLVFLPPNTTSVCQPLDQGIIKNFKVNYRKCILRHLIANIDSATCASDLGKKITVLDAIHWISSSINKIKKETVIHCFVKSGFNTPTNEVVASSMDQDEQVEELHNLLNMYQPGTDKTYIDIDDNVVTEDDSLDIHDIIQSNPLSDDDEDSATTAAESEELTDETPMKIEEVLFQINKLKTFFCSEGETEALCLVSSLQGIIENKIVNTKKIQTKITDYFC